jgi:conjugal transfer ATP-binding protein TraC
MTPGRTPPEPRESATWTCVGRRYYAPLLVAQFPPELPFGFVGRVLPTTEPVDLTVEAYPIASHQALALLHGARAVASAELAAGTGGETTPELEVERAAAEEFGRAVARRTQELWKVGICWVATGSSRPRVEAVRMRLAERLGGLGFRTRVPRYETGAALTPPGLDGSEERPSGYWQTLPTDGVATLFPFADESVVEPRGVLVGLSLGDASPVFLDRWRHSSHSWAVFGTTGSGKTFAAGLLLMRTRWMRPDTSIVILDPLGEFGAFVRSLGGAVLDVAKGGAGRLNPLDPATTGGDRREKAGRVGTMLRALFPSLTDEESSVLDAAVSRLYDRGPDVPTLEDLAQEIGHDPHGLGRPATLLEVFRSGSLRAANGPTTVATDAPVLSVDFRGVPEDQLPFHLSYVLDWAYGRMRDRPGPKLLVVDEAHLLLRHGATAEFLDRVVRHVRHFTGGLLLLSQSPEDFLRSESGESVLRNLYATGFLRLPEVSENARRFFGLTASEAEWLPKARLPREVGYSESLWRVGALHLPLAIIASTPEYEFLTDALGTAPGSEHRSSPAGGL